MNTKRKPLTFDVVLRLRFRRINQAQQKGFQWSTCNVRHGNAIRLRALVDDLLKEHACRSEAFPCDFPYGYCIIAGIRFLPSLRPSR